MPGKLFRPPLSTPALYSGSDMSHGAEGHARTITALDLRSRELLRRPLRVSLLTLKQRARVRVPPDDELSRLKTALLDLLALEPPGPRHLFGSFFYFSSFFLTVSTTLGLKRGVRGVKESFVGVLVYVCTSLGSIRAQKVLFRGQESLLEGGTLVWVKYLGQSGGDIKHVEGVSNHFLIKTPILEV